MVCLRHTMVFLFITPLCRLGHFKLQVFFMKFPVAFTFEFPGSCIHILAIVAFGLAFFCLAFFAEVAATGSHCG